MMKFLTLYLGVTGVAAFIALAAPGLVVLGFFLFVIPGLLLSLAPTAFLWGCLFTACWIGLRTILPEMLITAILAAVLTGAALVAVTQPNRTAGAMIYRSSLLPDVTPAEPIKMRGDIRIDVPLPRWDNVNSRGKAGLRGYSCDNLCLALLFTPGVTGVTINKSTGFSRDDHRNGTGGYDAEARTYRLVPKAQCGDGGLLPDLVGRNGLFAGSMEANTALSAEWNLKLASEVCLVQTATPARHDLNIREGSYGGAARRSSWSLLPSPARIEYLEIRDGGGPVLLRRFKSTVQILSRVLHVWGDGGIDNFTFGWGRTPLSNKRRYDAISMLAELEKHTDTRGKLSGEDLLPGLRKQLSAALEDPSLTGEAPAFQLLAAYFEAVEQPLPQEDLGIITRLARDDRVTRYDGIWKLKSLPEDQQRAIRSAFFERALTTNDTNRLARSAADKFLEAVGKGGFARLTGDEERLLGDPDGRWALPEIAARLHEGGAARVPMLMTLLREHSMALSKNFADANAGRIKSYEKSDENGGHRNMIDAVRISLCHLGPDAASALQPLRGLLASGAMPTNVTSGHAGSSWHLVLVRMGLPVEQLTKPASLSGTDEAHRKRIRDRLARFDPDRSCRR